MSAQNMMALEHANHIRLTRSRMRREIKAGALTVAGVLDEIPAELETMTVGQLLRSQSRWGEKRTRHLLSRCEIPEVRKLRDLTSHNRRLLAFFLSSSLNGGQGA